MRLVTYRRRTASGGTGSIGALSDGGLLDLGAVAGSMLELLVADGLDAAAGRRPGRPWLALDEVRAAGPAAAAELDARLHARRGARANSLGDVPAEWYEIPVYWKGNSDTVVGPEDEVPWPAVHRRSSTSSSRSAR